MGALVLTLAVIGWLSVVFVVAGFISVQGLTRSMECPTRRHGGRS